MEEYVFVNIFSGHGVVRTLRDLGDLVFQSKNMFGKSSRYKVSEVGVEIQPNRTFNSFIDYVFGVLFGTLSGIEKNFPSQVAIAV